MPISTMLPRGCSSTRGASSLPRPANLGGAIVRHANRLYMLSVQQESLHSKRISLEKRLADICEQLKRIDAEIQAAQSACNQSVPLVKEMKENGKRTRRKLGRGVELEY